MKDSSAATLHQAQDVFDSLSSVAACGQLFSAALDLCERCIVHTSEQGLRMSNELSALTDHANSLGYDQPADLFVRQLESNSDRAVLVATRMHEVMVAMKSQHSDLTSRYHAFVSQYTVFEHAVAEADKGSKHLQVSAAFIPVLFRLLLFLSPPAALVPLTSCSVARETAAHAAQGGPPCACVCARWLLGECACDTSAARLQRRRLLNLWMSSHSTATKRLKQSVTRRLP